MSPSRLSRVRSCMSLTDRLPRQHVPSCVCWIGVTLRICVVRAGGDHSSPAADERDAGSLATDIDGECDWMDMYRRRPPAQGGFSDPPAIPCDGVHGFCYLAPQSALYFGSTRRHPLEWRPVVSAIATQGRRYVLPATTQPGHDFYPLDPHRCFPKRHLAQTVTSWLCPQMELVDADALIEIGVLPHDESLRIVAWLRQREQERT